MPPLIERAMSREPYQDLYIYLIKGVVTEDDEEVLGEAFIGTWLEDDSSFLFFSRPSPQDVLALLSIQSQLELVEEHHFSYEEWHGGRIEPILVDRFLISPYWRRVNAEDGAIEILIDPGVVFGSGLHPTTRDCLKALVTLRDRQPWGRVMDLGTGTGILAVAAALLGAEHVLAVDLNPLCVKTARRNVQLNGLDSAVQVLKGKAEDFVTGSSDLIIANLHYDLLRRLITVEAFRQRGQFIFSGLLRSQAEDFRSQLRRYKLHAVQEWNHDSTWFTLLVESRML